MINKENLKKAKLVVDGEVYDFPIYAQAPIKYNCGDSTNYVDLVGRLNTNDIKEYEFEHRCLSY